MTYTIFQTNGLLIISIAQVFKRTRQKKYFPGVFQNFLNVYIINKQLIYKYYILDIDVLTFAEKYSILDYHLNNNGFE